LCSKAPLARWLCHLDLLHDNPGASSRYCSDRAAVGRRSLQLSFVSRLGDTGRGGDPVSLATLAKRPRGTADPSCYGWSSGIVCGWVRSFDVETNAGLARLREVVEARSCCWTRINLCPR